MTDETNPVRRLEKRLVAAPLWMRAGFATALLASWFTMSFLPQAATLPVPLLLLISLPWAMVSVAFALLQLVCGSLTLLEAARHLLAQTPTRFEQRVSLPESWQFVGGISATSLLMLLLFPIGITTLDFPQDAKLAGKILLIIPAVSALVLLARRPSSRSLKVFYVSNIGFFGLLSGSALFLA